MNKNSEENTMLLGKGISYFDSTKDGKRRSRQNKNEQLISNTTARAHEWPWLANAP